MLVICSTTIFAQTMVVKKSDGTYQEIAITPAVELSFYSPCPGMPTVTDTRDSKVYNTVRIGSQCWLKENLNVGTMITRPTVQTSNSIIEKYCYNNDTANCTTYGGLYQWAEAVQYQNGASNTTSPNPAFSGNVQGICPTGWHLPTQTEFLTLAAVVGTTTNGGTIYSGGKALKANGQGSGSGAGANTSGFSALLSGLVYYDGTFFGMGSYTYYWTSTEYSDNRYAFYMKLFNDDNIVIGNWDKDSGSSVRCVKD
ncbi:MAG: FISUMP domain-containing protein [Bacteroidota bacterium]|nr:FISUMP domain-containing protein [Bacteroidota bacterium]